VFKVQYLLEKEKNGIKKKKDYLTPTKYKYVLLKKWQKPKYHFFCHTIFFTRYFRRVKTKSKNNLDLKKIQKKEKNKAFSHLESN
jgi:hypothetical protein